MCILRVDADMADCLSLFYSEQTSMPRGFGWRVRKQLCLKSMQESSSHCSQLLKRHRPDKLRRRDLRAAKGSLARYAGPRGGLAVARFARGDIDHAFGPLARIRGR